MELLGIEKSARLWKVIDWDAPCYLSLVGWGLLELTLSLGFGGSKRTDEPAVLGSYLKPISRIT